MEDIQIRQLCLVMNQIQKAQSWAEREEEAQNKSPTSVLPAQLMAMHGQYRVGLMA